MKLTDQACKNAKPREKSYKLTDGGGLYLQVTPNGSKLWCLKYYYLNKEKKLSIGPYPIITLAEARKKRDEAKRSLYEGEDPSNLKKQRKLEKINESKNTFEAVARDWYALNKPSWSERTAEENIRRLERDVFPIIGSRLVKELASKDIFELANSIKERGATELAKRIVQMSRKILQYACLIQLVDRNVASDVVGMIKSAPTKHHAAIDPNEIPKFVSDVHEHMPKMHRQTYLAICMMMLTFVRTSELIKAEWDEFDLDEKVWIIKAHRMKVKNGRGEHIVPLSTQAVSILKELRQLHTHPVYVFPSRIKRDGHMSTNTILMALDRMGYRGIMTGHGFRSLAMSAIMEKLGYRYEVPDLQLAHQKRGDVQRAYDRAKFLDERKKMMQEWADYIDESKDSNKNR